MSNPANIGTRVSKSATKARKRAAAFKLESLEERTLLSTASKYAAAAITTTGPTNLSPSAATQDPSAGKSTNPGAGQQNPLNPALAKDPNAVTVQDVANGKMLATDPRNPVGPTPAENGKLGVITTLPASGSTSTGTKPLLSTYYAHDGVALEKKVGAVAGVWRGLTAGGLGALPAGGGDGPGGGIAPAQIIGAYGLNLVMFGGVQGDGTGQTIAIVDNGDNPGFLNSSDPNFATSALGQFDSFYGIPNLPSFSFQKYDQNGNPISGGPNNGWGLEIALDVEWAHAMAPGAKIDLVEGNSSSFSDLGTAQVSAASVLHASVVSMSYGAFLEFNGAGGNEPIYDSNFIAPGLAANPNTVYLAATGDFGNRYGPNYPAISPLVAGVGGTNLNVSGNSYSSESAWSGGGGGISSEYSAPAYQSGVTGYSARTNPDMSSAAVGVSIYDPFDYGGWVVADGTSWSTPTWAGFTAVADQGRALQGGQAFNGSTQQFQSALYSAYTSSSYNSLFNDITTGSNGFPATPGYDLATGIGTPKLQNLIPYLVSYQNGPGVVSETPALNSIVSGPAPSVFTVTFSEPIDPSTIVASDFTVNGIGANSASISGDDLTITYSYNSTPVTTEGNQTVNLPAGALKGLSGQNAGGLTGTFFYIKVQLAVQTTSPAPGSVLNAPVTDLVVQFNKAFDPSTINTADFQVSQGSVTGVTILTTKSVDLTLSGVTQDGTLVLTIPAGVITDLAGVGNAAYSATYIIQVNSQAFPTLTVKETLGFLIYDPTVTGGINFAGDSDSYTLNLAAGQQISALLTTDPGLTGTVSLTGPGGPIGSATAAGPGANVELESQPVTVAGTYTLTVTGSGSGNYTLQAILNAYVKSSTDPSTSLGSAVDLTSSFIGLNTANGADRAGALGTIDAAGDSDYYKFQLTAGQYATIASYGLGNPQPVNLLDSSGNPVALSVSTPTIDGLIENFLPSTSGWYYAQVPGASTAGMSYTMIVARGADVGNHGNSFANAQNLDGAAAVLGDILKGSGLYTLDDTEYVPPFPIYPTNTTTGAFGTAIPSPLTASNNPFGENMAYDGTDLYVNDGAFFGTNTIYKIDPATGTVLSQGQPIGTPGFGFNFTGLAFLGGSLYAGDLYGDVYKIDPNTYTVTGSFTNSSLYPLTGLTGNPDNGMLYGVNQFHQLMEIDPNTGNIVASGIDNSQGLYEQDIAYSGGQLFVSDANFPAYQGGTNVIDVYNASNFAYVTRLPVAVYGFASGLAAGNGQSSDWYQFSVTSGENITLSTTTPGGPPGQFVNGLNPQINIYAPDGTLVGSNAGGAGDGRNDLFSFTASQSGEYRVQVLAADKTSLGEYTLSVQGADTTAPAFTVTSTSVANGALLGYQVSSMDVQFSDSVLLSSLSTSDFTIDGNPATSYTVNAANDVTFNFVTTTNGPHNVSITGVVDIHGVTVTPDSLSFTTDDTPPTIVSSSISNGDVLSPGTIDEVVTFSEPINPATVHSYDFSLAGIGRGKTYTPASFVFDGTDTILTIEYTSIPTDAYTFNLYAFGDFQSVAGVPLQTGLTVNFTVPWGTNPFPVPLKQIAPVGGLAYQGSVDNVITAPGEVDTYTLQILGNQTLAILVTPVSSVLTPSITLTAPDGTVTTVTAPAAGQPALIPAVQAPTTGTYTIQVNDAGGQIGEYTIQAVLNALVDPASYGGPPDGSIGTAQPLDPYATSIGYGAQRIAVLGSITGSLISSGDAIVSARYNSELEVINPSGTVVMTIPVTGQVYGGLSGVVEGADGYIYAGITTGFFGSYTTGALEKFDMAGNLVATINLPTDFSQSGSSYYYYPYQFGAAPDGSFWVPQPNSGNVIHIDSSGNELASYYVGGVPEGASVRSDGTILIANAGNSSVEVLDPSTGLITNSAYSPSPAGVNLAPNGDNWVGDFNDGALKFNPSLGIDQQVGYYSTIAAQNDGTSSSAGIWDSTFYYGVYHFDQFGNFLAYSPVPYAIGLTVPGVDGPAPPAPNSPVYSINVSAGESVSVALSSLNGKNVSFILEDGSGNPIALSAGGAVNYSQGISDFVSSTGGTYYIAIQGDLSAKFNVVVTENSGFDAGGSKQASPQALDSSGTVLGALTPGAGLFTLDDTLYTPPFPIYPTNTSTGAFGTAINSPLTAANNPFGENMAYDGTYLYVNDGAEFGTNTIYKIDATTGAIISQGQPIGDPGGAHNFTGLAFLGGSLYGADLYGDIYRIDPNTYTVTGSFTNSSLYPLTGLTGNGDNGTLYAVSQFHELYQLDPNTGSILASAPDNSGGLYEQDIAYSGGQLFVSDANFPAYQGGTNVIDVYDASTFAFERRMPVAVYGFVSGLAGGTGAPSQDWYGFQANAGDSLTISLSLPGDPTGTNQFPDLLNAEFQVYDPSGTLVGSFTGQGSLSLPAALTGSYEVQVESADNTSTGEYVLNVTGNTGGPQPFVVTSSNPATGALVYPPSSYTVTFSAQVLISSLAADEFTITTDSGSETATSYIVDGPNTVTFYFDPSIYPSENRGVADVSITADGGGNIPTDLTGTQLGNGDGYSSTFTFDNVAPTIVSSSIDNSVFSPAPQTVTETVDFSETMNTSFIDVSLYGNDRGIFYSPASEVWQTGPNGPNSELVLTYANLPDDVYSLSLYAGGFQDLVGNVLQNTYTAPFAVAFGSGAFPTLTPVKPLGSLIYEGDASHVLVSGSDYDTYTIALNPGQTLSIQVTPLTSGLQPDVQLVDPNGNIVGQATYNPTDGYSLLNAAAITTGGTYTFYVFDDGYPAGATGLYDVHLDLNALIKPDQSVDTPGGALNLDASSYSLGYVNSTRDGVVGSLPYVTNPSNGDALVIEGFNSDVALVSQATGQVIQRYYSPDFASLALFDIAIAPDNTFYVLGDFNGFTGVIVHMDLSGNTLGEITMPVTDSSGYYSPEGFGLAPDGSFWVPLLNSGNIIHVDSSGNLTQEYSVGGLPIDAAVGPDGLVYYSNPGVGQIDKLDPTSGATSVFTTNTSFPLKLTWTSDNTLWVGDDSTGGTQYDSSGNLINNISVFGVNAASGAPASTGNIWTANSYYGLVNQYNSADALLTSTSLSLFDPGLAVFGEVPGESSLPPADTQDYYSFTLAPSQTATIVGTSLNSTNIQITLLASDGTTVLATGVGGASNATSTIQNFLDSGSGGTYYVKVTGDQGAQYSLVVTKDSTFSLQPNNSQNTAQNVVVNPSTDSGGVLGYLGAGGGISAGTGFAGATGTDANNNCGCLPPDTNAAVNSNYVVETVNTEFVVYDKSGNELFSETLNSFFAPTGQSSIGDVYAVWDPSANRWYIDSIDANNNADLLFAISNDANPLDGFSTQFVIPVAASGDLADFPKFGYNADYITFAANDFGSGDAKVTVLNKADALAGSLVDVQLVPSPQFRALVPAQDPTATPGEPIWFVGSPFLGLGSTNNVIRVTELQNPFGSATFTDTFVPVNTYGGYTAGVDQPGAPGSVAANDNTTTQVFEYNGTLVTAFPASTGDDGYFYPKVHYYKINVGSGSPVLALQGVIDPGPGVATFFPTATMNPATGDLGLTWMQSSSSEYVSMYVGTVSGSTGALAVYDAAPGVTTEFDSGRNGDYSTVVYDSSTDTFWAANEYAGPNNGNDIWDTWIQQFSPSSFGEQNWYSVNVQAGGELQIITSTPGDAGFGQFSNPSMVLTLNLYDSAGNPLPWDQVITLPDGRNEYVAYLNPAASSQFFVQVSNVPGTGTGEYFMDVATPAYTATSVSGDIYNDLLGVGSFQPGDPGLNGWTVDLFDANGNFVTSQVTHTINGVDGSYDFEGLDPGQYTVEEIVQAGWTATTAVAVPVDTTGGSVSGIDFGDFQYVTISGLLFNDLLGVGFYQGGDPGLPGWTVDLVDYNNHSHIYQSVTTDVNGNYTFSNVGPGTYAVLQEIPGGWIQTYPPNNGFYGGYVVSGSTYSGLDYGDFELVTYSGIVFNDITGSGVYNGSDPGLGGFTVNLYTSSFTFITSVTCANDGTYSFTGIGPGSYIVQETTPTGWILTTPTNPPWYTLTATSGQNTTGLNCGNFKLATFSGNVFNDLNGNGVQNKGEPGLATWTVELLNPSGNVAYSTVTNKSGNYSFTGIYPGNFTVAEVVKSGWYQTTTPTTYSVQSQSGATVTGLTFGDKKGSAPGVTIGGHQNGGMSALPTTTTDLSVPSSYLGNGPSTVVVPGASQAGPVTVVYNDGNIATKDQIAAALQALYQSKKKITEEDIIALLAKSILGGGNA